MIDTKNRGLHLEPQDAGLSRQLSVRGVVSVLLHTVTHERFFFFITAQLM